MLFSWHFLLLRRLSQLLRYLYRSAPQSLRHTSLCCYTAVPTDRDLLAGSWDITTVCIAVFAHQKPLQEADTPAGCAESTKQQLPQGNIHLPIAGVSEHS